jgi:hypothetical protein
MSKPALPGRNNLHLNRATMNAAVEYYLRHRVLVDDAVTVDHIALSEDTFIVCIVAVEEKKP